jgi:hypothetical protein
MPELPDTSEVAGLGPFDGPASRSSGSGCLLLAGMSGFIHDGIWDLTLTDRPLVEAKRLANRLRFAVMLLFFRARGRFPRRDHPHQRPRLTKVAAGDTTVGSGPGCGGSIARPITARSTASAKKAPSISR